ncbi:hypothetical protein [Salipiger thiooxidans]|uniref:hypothetical protein n=1 Tax=Salipiger thiooxidans TaxID=282683 RepID=UPI0013F4C703|nr:hypothetical protein [Salipiger thiooxidans]
MSPKRRGTYTAEMVRHRLVAADIAESKLKKPRMTAAIVRDPDEWMIRELAEYICLVARFDGVILSQEWKEALWDKFVTVAPRPRTPSELQYSDRKLRSRN